MIEALEQMRDELQEAAENELEDARAAFRQEMENLKLRHENDLREQRNAINTGYNCCNYAT